MLPIISREVVDKRKWSDEDEMTDIIAISESTPGPIAVNCATFIGYKIGGVLGSIIATLGLVVPSFIIISLISLFFDWFIGLEYVKYAFMGIRCAVALLILSSAYRLFKKLDKNYLTYILLACGFAITLFLPNVSAIYVILGGAVVALTEFLIRNKICKDKVKEVEHDS